MARTIGVRAHVTFAGAAGSGPDSSLIAPDRGAATSHDPESAPSVPAEAREELLALKSGGVFVCARRDGDLRPGRASGEGLYADDTRHLSELRLTVGGLQPVLLSSVMESGHHAVINATNPVLRADDGVTTPQETLNVRRTVLIDDRLHYGVRVRNFHHRRIATTVELSLAADFADVFEVRGVDRRTSGRVLAPTLDDERVRFAYLAADGQRRETVVEMNPSPARIDIDEQRGKGHVARGARGTRRDLAAGHDRPRSRRGTTQRGHGRSGGHGARGGSRRLGRPLCARDERTTSSSTASSTPRCVICTR